MIFGFACGLVVGGLIQLTGISGLPLYVIWVLAICVVLAFVAPWALRGTGQRILIQEASEPRFQLVRLWYGRSSVVSGQEEGSSLGDDDLDFLADGSRYEPYYVHVK